MLRFTSALQPFPWHTFFREPWSLSENVTLRSILISANRTVWALLTNYSTEPFYEDELVIATPATKHYMALKKSDVSLKTLLKKPLIIREKGSGTRRETERMLSLLGMSLDDLNVALCMNDPEAIPSSIIAGVGISILSRKVVEDLEKEGKLLLFPFMDPPARRSLYIVWCKDRFLNRQTKDFIRLLKDMFSKKI
jgi:DNA-binding transcriptional LysR family regulator